MSAVSPVFLIPLGRTGGTLMVTILDAHPDLAMSYEIYEDRLINVEGAPMQLDWILREFNAARPSGDDPVAWIKGVSDKNLQTFFYRARRAGLEVPDVLSEIEAHSIGGGTLDTLAGRLDLIERLMKRKMNDAGKRGWGGKARIDPRELHARQPDARFLAMIRDGRDMFASMLNTGDFRTNASKAAHEWLDHIRDFRAFAALPGVHAMEVRYEQLIADPPAVLQDVCAFIGVPFADEMLQFHEKDMSLFRSPHGHLSHKQIARGLGSESIGRWQRDLSAEDVDAFTDIAGSMLGELDYV